MAPGVVRSGTRAQRGPWHPRGVASTGVASTGRGLDGARLGVRGPGCARRGCAGLLFGLTAEQLARHLGHNLVLIGSYPAPVGHAYYGRPELVSG
jgi:hypothetical protein